MFQLNGTRVKVAPEHHSVRLVDYLRDHLHLKGTKFGCGVGQCGACTIHLDGDAVRSCQLTVEDVFDSQVTTIEGLAPVAKGGLHPVQQAWIANNVPQCGYCQAGQIMSAVALLQGIPNPDDAEINAAMTGNICRCGTYSRIRAAIKLAATQMEQTNPEMLNE